VEIAEKLKQNDKNKSLCQMSTKINSCNATMFIFPVTETETEEVIKNFQGKHSAGTDEILDYVVKKCIEAIKKPLAHLCNASLECGSFPDMFKIAKVKRLYKKGDKNDIQNYRLISLLCAFSKILEKLMHNRLISFFIKKKYINGSSKWI
jgi:hypothetical protein